MRDLSSGTEKVYYIHNDHLGTPKAMTNNIGTVVWRASHDPFGKATRGESRHHKLLPRIMARTIYRRFSLRRVKSIMEITPRKKNEGSAYFVDIALPPGRGAGAIIEQYGEEKVKLRSEATCPRGQ